MRGIERRGYGQQWHASNADSFGFSKLETIKIRLKKVDYRTSFSSLLSRYSNPGPIQFIGPTCDANHATLDEAGESYGARLERLHEALEEVKNKCRPGCPNATVDTALMMAESLSSVLDHTVQ